MTTWSINDHMVIKARSADNQTRTLLIGDQSNLKDSLSKLIEAAGAADQAVVWASGATWVLGDIEAGVPSIYQATQDSFVPQMVNFEQLDGLSFKKGCYPGQEIVARMHYLGKLKRHMRRRTR